MKIIKVKCKDAIPVVLGIKVLEESGAYAEPTEQDVRDAERVDYLTQNKGRDGNDYLWYYDGRHEACMNIKTKKFISKSQISKLFE